MTLNLNPQEIDQVILSILCNGALSFASQSGLDYNYDRSQYNAHKEGNQCHEDVLLAMLKSGGKIEFIDEEGDGDYNKDLTLALATEKLSDIEQGDIYQNVTNIITGEGDAEDDYCVLQYILYGEVIFG